MKNLLLVGRLDEAKTIPHEGMLVVSVRGSVGRGFTFAAVYATPAAMAHPNYERRLAELAPGAVAASMEWHGAKRVI